MGSQIINKNKNNSTNSRASPAVPPRFSPHDIVIYNGHEAEINRILSPNEIEITYPVTSYIMQRQKAVVPPQHLQRRTKRSNPTSPPLNNNNNIKHHQYSQTQTILNKASNSQQPPSSNNKLPNKHKMNHKIPPFESHMTLQQGFKLKIHDKIDHRDQVGRFVFATVSEKQGTNLKIHYDGWSRKWDTWSDFNKEIHRFAAAGSISKRPSHRFSELKKGDYVDINPSQRHPGWKCGEIRRLDQKSGQVQVVYECGDKNYLYWAHLDNLNEIAEFTSKSGHMTQASQAQNMQNIYNQKDIKKEEIKKEKDKEKEKNVFIEPMEDEMEAFARIRAKRFPKYPNEAIKNVYGIGDWLEVQDTQTLQWITATVIDKENNWIVVHFDGWPSKYDQKIHAVKHKKRLRGLGAGLAETQEEKDIKEEMESFLKEVQELNWRLVEVDADGNCLYRCFGTEIYGDTGQHIKVRAECCKYMRENVDFFSNFIPDFDQRMKEKEEEYEWGDHVDITALSELYNVRVRVFEYDKDQKKLYMSFDQGEHEETVNLPLILLARHRKKHYNIILDPQAVHKRPLSTAERRNHQISLKGLRLKEDAKEMDEEKGGDDEDEKGGDDEMVRPQSMNILNNEYSMRSQSVRSLTFSSGTNVLSLEQSDFIDIMEIWNLSEPLQANDLQNIFKPLIKKIYKKIEFQWNRNHQSVNKGILDRFWTQQFDTKQHAQNNPFCKKWIISLKEKIPNQQYPMIACLNSFNQTIVLPITDNLGHVVEGQRKRQSTIDIHRSQQPMDIDQ